MEAIKKIANVHNNTIIIHGLDTINNKKVEVIIIPLADKKKAADKSLTNLSGKLLKFDDPFEPAVSIDDWDVLK